MPRRHLHSRGNISQYRDMLNAGRSALEQVMGGEGGRGYVVLGVGICGGG